ncbi:MAG: aminopeptidase [Lachnospiraceae bacterium]
MNRSFIYEERNKEYQERYNLCVKRIEAIKEESLLSVELQDYFNYISDFTALLDKSLQLVLSGELYSLSLEQLKALNHELYANILYENYSVSFLNPDFICKKLGKRLGKVLGAIASQLQDMIYEAYSGNLARITVELELILEIYGIISLEGKDGVSAVKKALYYHHHDYCMMFTDLRQRRMKTPEYNDIICILDECDLYSPEYLYYYGVYVGDNELKTVEFLTGLEQDEINKIADVYVGGYVRGFEAAGIDFSERMNVEIRYPVGFELIIKASVKRFRDMGKNIVMYMDDSRRIGVSGSLPNRQYVYDHRNDFVLWYSKRYVETAKECLDKVYRDISDTMSKMAGPACMETYGESDFVPVNKDTAISPDNKMNELLTSYKRDCALLLRKYVDMEKTSFTIIAYPLPEIGEQYSEIFHATNMVNMLDNKQYCQIQQNIIDTLDKGQYVCVKGSGDNRTDLKICLHALENPEKETNFENCTADVNIPVGEVFTSPVLKGTEGVLNVSRAFLEGLEFKNLTIIFKDGFISDYSCENFNSEEENRKYIEENILFRHETLPIGEFAIGTNTTAYKMANDFHIWHKMPILIAEKTGPHFAVGDTCYSDMEDFMTYNPDGKAIVARDNEASILRKTDRSKAYFNCHTDITIPYDELDYIRVYLSDGNVLSVIEEGKFVVPGTEVLNEALN